MKTSSKFVSGILSASIILSCFPPMTIGGFAAQDSGMTNWYSDSG